MAGLMSRTAYIIKSKYSALLNRTEQVRARVEAMIGRLKTLEHGA